MRMDAQYSSFAEGKIRRGVLWEKSSTGKGGVLPTLRGEKIAELRFFSWWFLSKKFWLERIFFRQFFYPFKNWISSECDLPFPIGIFLPVAFLCNFADCASSFCSSCHSLTSLSFLYALKDSSIAAAIVKGISYLMKCSRRNASEA